jgi:hypothetical protein
VVGVNTSAQIEAAIAGRIVSTIASPDFAHSQAGTLHFQHLVQGGLLDIAPTFDAHVANLSALVRDVPAQAARARRFVESFVRPFGMEEPATPRMASAIVAMASQRAAAQAPDGAALRAARRVLHPVARFVATMPERRPWWVYVMRPVLWAGVQVWALPYRLADGMRSLASALARAGHGFKDHGRRFLVEPGRKSLKRLRSRSRHAVHRVRVNVRLVGARVLRLIR